MDRTGDQRFVIGTEVAGLQARSYFGKFGSEGA